MIIGQPSSTFACIYMNSKPLILITNDDGITSPGIRALVDAVRDLGEVVIIAPDSPQSAMGHAITINKPLRVDKNDLYPGIESYHCSGTPVDCVKLAHHQILHRLPDLVLSGINHGSNAAINVIYSGTMSAAVEAAVEGIPAVGFSLQDYSYHADFSICRPLVREVTQKLLANKMPDGTLLNVNFPKGDIKGMKICRQAKSKWKEDFEERLDPAGRKYFWLVGKFINMDEGTDTDEAALAEGYASIVPTQFDLTAYKSLDTIKSWF